MDSLIERILGNSHDLDWQDRGLCRETDPDAFFPAASDKARGAKAVCGSCDVRSQCLEYALKNREQHGIWGGLTLNERYLFKRKGLNPTERNIDLWLAKSAKRYEEYIERYREVNRKYLD